MLERAHVPRPVEEAVRRLRGALRERFGARLCEVVLFGSYARGDAHEDSDVDVLVVVDALTPRERMGIFALAREVDAACPGPLLGLSVVAHSRAEAARMRARGRGLYAGIDREGIRA